VNHDILSQGFPKLLDFLSPNLYRKLLNNKKQGLSEVQTGPGNCHISRPLKIRLRYMKQN
jgi:hypothetical protein